MKPSDVVLVMPPLTATFGRAELEHTAALLVFCCWQLGDTWQPIGVEEITQLHALELRHQLPQPKGSAWLRSFSMNPFVKLSPEQCVAHPEWFTADAAGRLSFTAAGLERLMKWVPS